MKGCVETSWKSTVSIVLAIGYLGLFISYLKIPSKEKFLSTDQPLGAAIQRTTSTVNAKAHKFNVLKHKQQRIYKTNSVLEKRKAPTELWSQVIANLTSREMASDNAKIVIIAAYMRSGSTFMGGAFQRYPDAFYVFEPLRLIVDAMRNNGLVEYVSGRRRNVSSSDTIENVILQDTKKWLSCNFHEIDLDSLVNKHHEEFKDGMWNFFKCARGHVETIKKLRSKNNTLAEDITRRLDTENQKAINDCLDDAKRRCLAAPIRVIKFIRLRMPLIAELLPLYPNMKVIYLQRDPRGMLRSRLKTGLVKYKNFTTNVDNQCNSSLNDIQTLRGLAKQYPDRLKPVLYEDVAESPVKRLQDIFKFCNLSFSKDMKDFIMSLTSLGGADSCRFCVQRGNSTKTAYKWRQSISMNQVLYIDKQCSAVYDILGYKRFFRLSDLRNLSVPSRAKETKLIL